MSYVRRIVIVAISACYAVEVVVISFTHPPRVYAKHGKFVMLSYLISYEDYKF